MPRCLDFTDDAPRAGDPAGDCGDSDRARLLEHGVRAGARRFAPRAFAAGAGMGILALLTGSILPGIVLHALVDLAGGYVAHLALRDPEPVATAAVA